MKKTSLIIGALVICALIGALVRFISVAGSSMGAGGGVDSPDKRFLAEAMSFEGEKFWGGKFTYYEFTIKTTNGDLICHYKLHDPPQPLSDWREESEHLIQWATNNSSVTYNFKGGHLNLSVNP
jgi:hypothetical protein